MNLYEFAEHYTRICRTFARNGREMGRALRLAGTPFIAYPWRGTFVRDPFECADKELCAVLQGYAGGVTALEHRNLRFRDGTVVRGVCTTGDMLQAALMKRALLVYDPCERLFVEGLGSVYDLWLGDYER